MERTKWTDDLLDERMANMDEKLDALHGESRLLRDEMRTGFADLRSEVNTGFSELRKELATMRTEFRAELIADRAQLGSLQRQVIAVMTAFMVGVIGLFATVLARL